MRHLSVYAVTYNVGDTAPPDVDFSKLVGLECRRQSDVLFIGLQEVLDGEKWLAKIKQTVVQNDYILLKYRNCWGIWMFAFIKRNLLIAVTNIESEVTASGTLGIMGNKGGVSIRFELCGVNIIGVCAHFAAHKEKFSDRVNDYLDIIQKQSFRDPDVNTILDHDYVIWMGDLNFRLENIDKKTVESMIEVERFQELWKFDQLIRARSDNIIFNAFNEGALSFPPTYKYDPNSDVYDSSTKQRVPSWTDRILFMDHNSFALDENVQLDSEGRRMAATSRKFEVRGPPSKDSDLSISESRLNPTIQLLEYSSLTDYKGSDHRPVYVLLELCIPDRWFNLPIHFVQPQESLQSGGEDLDVQYTLMDPPALNSCEIVMESGHDDTQRKRGKSLDRKNEQKDWSPDEELFKYSSLYAASVKPKFVPKTKIPRHEFTMFAKP